MKLDPSISNDIAISEIGEISIFNGDFSTVSNTDEILQGVMTRVKTVIGDAILTPQMGCSLEELIGEPNSLDTGSEIKARIISGLTHDGWLSDDEIEVIVQPINLTQILATIIITFNGEESSLSISLDLSEGKLQLV